MRMAERKSAAELLGAGIHALAHADAAQLETLVRTAHAIRVPGTAEERRMAREGLRAMALLLTLTRRNLRLLRGRGPGGYGPLAD